MRLGTRFLYVPSLSLLPYIRFSATMCAETETFKVKATNQNSHSHIQRKYSSNSIEDEGESKASYKLPVIFYPGRIFWQGRNR